MRSLGWGLIQSDDVLIKRGNQAPEFNFRHTLPPPKKKGKLGSTQGPRHVKTDAGSGAVLSQRGLCCPPGAGEGAGVTVLSQLLHRPPARERCLKEPKEPPLGLDGRGPAEPWALPAQ